ncbi:MAG TPA: dienelactone hydrolase family protein [Vicinamibacterales bacterium]|nr:dienelactone hydrolase family protein [Vicinamibacterales bacterium]
MGERVSFKSNGGTTDGYLAQPATGRGPGVVVIQEYWGLVPQIERTADRFAAEGFVALAPDLYHGTTTRSPDQAGKLMMALRIDDAARDLAGAIDCLAAQPGVAPKRVGTVGFCMGGALSLYAAAKNPEVGACVVFYGGHPNVKPDLPALAAPVLGIYGGRDTFVTPAVVAELDAELTRLGKRHEFHTYPDAVHAFFNEARPEVHDPAASADAWARTIAFLHRELKA